MKRGIIFILILFSVFTLEAVPYKIRYLTADDGLSRNLVNQIFKDSRGFIWIATAKGLDRYDGYRFISYNSHQRSNPLPDDVVKCIQEDDDGNIWIGTENGLYLLEYTTGIIKAAAEQLKIKDENLQQNFQFINKDETGQLWLCHSRGVSVVRCKINGEYELEEVYAGDNILDMMLVDGQIYLARENEIIRIIRDTQQRFTRLNTEEGLQNISGTIRRLFHDHGILWIGTSDGLYKYDIASGVRQHYTYPNALSSNSITAIRKNTDGKILVGTLIGLNIYDYHTDQFSRIDSESIQQGVVLNNNFISDIFVDQQFVWIGTEKGGVNLLMPDQRFFYNIVHQPDNPSSISKNPVNAIFEDPEGDLWVGTVEGGLNIRRKGRTGFEHILHEPGNPKSLTHNSVSTITQDINGNYWIGTWGGGVNLMLARDKKRPVFERFVNMTHQPRSISNNFVAALTSDPSHRGVWVGTVNGINFLDINKREFYPILNELPADLSIRLVTGMMIDSQRYLWVGTGNGLFIINLNESKPLSNEISFRHYKYELSSPESGRTEKINTIFQARDGRIWLGSNGNGLYLFQGSREDPTFKRYDLNDGLIDNVIYGLVEDDAGTLWMSTDKGLSAFDPIRNSFRNFTTADGLGSNQFYWDAYLKGADGRVYFGHVAGFTVFDPMRYLPPSTINRVSVTSISILNEQIFPARKQEAFNYLSFDKSTLIGIQLRENDKAFSIEFSALSFYMPEKIRYAYRLKGFDNEWQIVSADRRFANFTNINAGRYEFEMKCTNPDGSWSDIITTLHIRIIPPFYKTWWFMTLLTLILLLTIFYFINYRIRSLKRQEIHLKLLVEERTREIEEQKEKVQEATVDKIAFFTNITHEFRTPVTLILGPVERALKLSSNPKVLEQLQIVRRNSKLLLSLINQLMDFRKIESGKMELSKSQHNFEDYLNEILLPFEDLAKDRNITFVKQYRFPAPEFLFDRDSMQKLMGNLLSNAIKFTPDRGKITVIASTYFDKRDQKEKLYVAVRDSGNGIPEADLELIFERFYQSKFHEGYSGSGQSGTGIGLFLCKKIIDLYDGKIEALNHHSGGAMFRFIIPVERKNTTMVALDGASVTFEHDLPIEETEDNKTNIVRGKPLLLIVEDNSDMRNYIRSILSERYNVLEAPHGVIGYDLTTRYLPDLIISDVMMPEMDGLTFCRQVKSNFNTSHIPVVLLSAKSATEVQVEGFTAGADAYLVKPFDEQLLKALLHNLAEKKQSSQHQFMETLDSSVLNFEEASQDKKFIEKALSILRNHYTDPDFDVTEFITVMGISRSLLHKKLTHLTGQSASRFIRSYRLNTARELIIKNRNSHAMNISEIAYQVGFNDPKYFTRCFTKQFNIQPSILMEDK